jgi:hypothetical protein
VVQFPEAPVYVLDADSFLQLPTLLPDGSIHSLLDDLGDLVQEGYVTFPDHVLNECKRIAKGELIFTWMKAISASRKNHKVAYAHTVQVLAKCRDLLDEDAPEEQSPLAVAAMAHYLNSTDLDCVVVTEDRRPLPTRLCLSEACGVLGIPELTVVQFLADVQLDQHLAA